MKLKIYSLLGLFILLSSCKEDEGIDCSLVDCAFQAFTIEFVDADGTNLIENGRYDQSTIIVRKNGNQINSTLNTSDILYFEVMGEVGTNTYEIRLNDSETDILVLDLSGENIRTGCCGPYYDISTALYNGTAQEILQDEYYFAKIVVTK
jgi:hypothetical protein